MMTGHSAVGTLVAASSTAVVALLPANTVDDGTIEVYADESRQQAMLRWSPLRLQTERR